MDITQQILSDITVYSKYAHYIEKEQRRETWTEIVDRYINMMNMKYRDNPTILRWISLYSSFIYEKKILPSMRALQFAGPAIEKNPARIYNCGYLPVDDYRAFSEIMFLLLSGTGCGYSVQYHHVDKLPEIKKPTKTRRYLIADSIEGWADAVKVLVKSYFGYSSSKPIFDFSDIRVKGSRLLTSGGKAPGPEPLKRCLMEMEFILERKVHGSKLTPLEVHDLVCHIANAVLAGGIRRAALISLFSFDDEEMLSCKSGNWWELNEQRGRANNSAVILRDRITEPEFKKFWEVIKASNAGEPGVYFTNDIECGTNPCCEIALRPFSFCNLTEINIATITNGADYAERCKAAALFGTLQAGFTDFHYLRDIWKRTTEKDALIGVGQTGIASKELSALELAMGAVIVKETNEIIANFIGINKAARTTTVKPSGTTSCVLGTSSGIHAWHSKYYIRRQRIGKDEALYTYLAINHPELVKDEYFRPHQQAVIEIPQQAQGDMIIVREDETALSLLDRVAKYNKYWVKSGHRTGSNTNNVSATISIKEEEWEAVGNWMWENRNSFNGLSVLPYDGGTYIQAPFETITEEEFLSRKSTLLSVDLSKVVELDDTTNLVGEAACSGGACEISL